MFTKMVIERVSANQANRRTIMTFGPLWLTISAILFAIMAVMVRLAGMQNIPGSEATFVRFIFGLASVVSLQKIGVAHVYFRRKWLLAARGITGGAAILFYFLSLASVKGSGHTTLTNSVLLGNSYFIFAPLFGALLIRERLRLGTILAVIAALGGLYLVIQPDFSHVRAGDVYGLAAGVISGLAIVIIRELRKTEPAISIFFSLCVFGALAGLIGMLFEGAILPPNFNGWLVLLVMGITSTAGQLSMTYALRWARAGEAGIIQMTTVIYSSIVGVLWLGDPFNCFILLGGFIVLASAAYISFAQNWEVMGE
ncbi:MAG: DMT family transporter [Armatimonadota bacterium]|nr:DMT family transporter [Armatimonadota bacterium]